MKITTTRIRAGYTAVKICPTGVLGFLDPPDAVRSIADRVAAVRDAIGTGHDLAVDLHGRASIRLTRQLLPLIAGQAPLSVEEPLRRTCPTRSDGSRRQPPAVCGDREVLRA